MDGGVEAVIPNYFRNINKSKFVFDFVIDSDSTDNNFINEIQELGGTIIKCPPYQKLHKYNKFLYKLFKEKNYDIVHSNINTLSVFPLRMAEKAGIKIRIAHSHSTSNPKEWKKNLLKNILRPFSKKYANVYFACSELAGRYLFGNKAFDEGKVVIINNAIDIGKFKYNEEIRKSKRNEIAQRHLNAKINDNTLIVGNIGRMVAQKNQTFLIDIFDEVYKLNENSILLIIGQGPLKEMLHDKVQRLNLQSNVLFLGQRQDANEIYQAMDVLCLPSLYEGLPVVGVEAQANGLLCELSSSMTKETKILDTTRFISLNESAEKWAKIILKDYKNYKRKDAEKEMTEKNFNIKVEAEKLEKEYIKIIKE